MSCISSFLKFFACKSDCNSDCESKCLVGPKKILLKIFSSEKLNENCKSDGAFEEERNVEKYPTMPPFANLN